MAEFTTPFKLAARRLAVSIATNRREVSTAMAAQRGVAAAAVQIRQDNFHFDFTQRQALSK
jgi:hypothetical protein